ncbi:MAG: rRNA biogenesis protein rrp5 [Dethiobacter sp.]|jgi:hypothetical protein|nr:MAG: rRNA biogenesis protein rrp5 [Dethiobacter sp.]
MSKIKLALDVAEDLRSLAGSIEALVKAIEANEEKPAAEETVTLEKVRAVLAEKTQSGKQAAVKALITKYGANKLTDIDPSSYKELLKEAEVL